MIGMVEMKISIGRRDRERAREKKKERSNAFLGVFIIYAYCRISSPRRIVVSVFMIGAVLLGIEKGRVLKP